MYKELDGITPPDDWNTLWRYMSLEKFVNMLETKSLFFTRADKFEDPFEGFTPPALVESYRKSVKRVILDESFTEVLIKISENSRKYVMCNCWHQNEEESMAMWEKYHMRNGGIAIKTTVQDLKNSLLNRFDVFIGEIEYIYHKTYDYNFIQHYTNTKTNTKLSSDKRWTYFPYFHKRKAFEHEHEVRIIIDVEPFVSEYLEGLNPKTVLETEFPDICDIGMSFNVNVKRLINEIIISPYAEKWVTDTVKSVVHKYGFDFEVSPSELLEDPTLDDIIHSRF